MSFTQQDARAIAKKLGAEVQTKKKHDMAVVRYHGRIVAHYGIRRASREVGHDHIPHQLYISRQQALVLAQCSRDRDGYFAVLREQGLLPEEERRD